MPKSYLCTHVCSSAFPCLYSGYFTVCVRLCAKKKKKKAACKCVYERVGTCACVRSPQPHRVSPHPCQGLVPSHPSLKWQTANRHTHTHTHTQCRTQSSAGAKVNRWAGLNWLAVCSDCKLRWWWLENSSTGCRLLKLSRENNFLLCSGNFFFFAFSPSRCSPLHPRPPL